jgi:circadian clock protein KaiC
LKGLAKCPTGISGLDEITGGGFPRGRPTLITGYAGSGKTLFGLEFLVHGARDYGEPGVYRSFEESEKDLITNVASLGWNLQDLIDRKLLSLDNIIVEKSEIEETGEYDLEGLFVRINYAIESIGAKRIVIDTLEALFAGLGNEAILRAELRLLFKWLKDKGMTAVITGERGNVGVTRYGIEEYISDCVITLDHRVTEQISTRRLRIVKYRGTYHGTNEYPFIIGEKGISVLPITSLKLEHKATSERKSSGLKELDEMLSGKGYYKGSTVLISGPAGTGKTSLTYHFVDASCRKGEKCLVLAFEESPDQIVRNMKSIGLDIRKWLDSGNLTIVSERPSVTGLEAHLVAIHNAVESFKPQNVVMDPMSNLVAVGSSIEVKSVLTRMIDYLKSRNITTILTSLTPEGKGSDYGTSEGISSLIDTWISLEKVVEMGKMSTFLTIVKSRGMSHSNEARHYIFTEDGIKLQNVHQGLEAR